MNLAYGDPNALATEDTGVGWPWRTTRFTVGEVFVERLLVRLGPPQNTFPSWSLFKGALDAAPPIIQQDLANFHVIGVNILPLAPNDTIATWEGEATLPVGEAAYLLDYVFTPIESETSWINPETHDVAAAKSLARTSFRDAKTLPNVKLVALRSIEGQSAAMWLPQGPLSTTTAGETIEQGSALKAGYERSPKTWGQQLAIGLADFPVLLKPLVGTELVTSNADKGKLPLFKWPGGGAVKAPSNENLLVWGLFAAGGVLLAREMWKVLRG